MKSEPAWDESRAAGAIPFKKGLDSIHFLE